jgi:hypothetical protein
MPSRPSKPNPGLPGAPARDSRRDAGATISFPQPLKSCPSGNERSRALLGCPDGGVRAYAVIM